MQSLDRAVAVLRTVAAAGTGGARLSDVAAGAALSRSTAHRFLLALAGAGLLDEDAAGNRFHLGLELCALGAAAANRYELRDLARPSMERLAQESGDTVYLSLRDGMQSICAERIEGGFPIRTLTLDVGDRRPLGVGAGSLAILAFQDDSFVARAIAANARSLRQYKGFGKAELAALVTETRSRGHAFNDQLVVPGMSAIGAPVLDREGHSVGALSIAAISSRFGGKRRGALAAMLNRESRLLEAELARVIGPLTESRLLALGRHRRSAPAERGRP